MDEKPNESADQQHKGLRKWLRAPGPSAPPIDPLLLVAWLLIYFGLLAFYVYQVWNLYHGVSVGRFGRYDISEKPGLFWLSMPWMLMQAGLLLFLGYATVCLIYRKLYMMRRDRVSGKSRE